MTRTERDESGRVASPPGLSPWRAAALPLVVVVLACCATGPASAGAAEAGQTPGGGAGAASTPAPTAPGGKPATSTSTDVRLKEKRALVEKAAADDLFFWQRYLRRLENPGEFPQPDSFYVPSQLLEGDASAPLPPARARDRRVSEAHWSGALEWAKAHQTEVLAVARNGKLEFAWFGPGRDGGSLLPVRSIAKPLTALAVGAAIAEGRIRNVQQPVGDFLEGWRTDDRGRITLEQLLTMSSGLNSFPPDPAPLGLTLQLAEGSDIRATALAHSLVAAPGTRYAWGNVESQLLAMAVASASGMSYRDYLQSRLWKPLGLGTASLNVDRDGQTRAFCCLRIRADDLLKIGLMLVDGGEWQGRRILPAEWVAQMFSPSAINPYHGYQAFLGWTGAGPRLADPPLIQRNDVPFAEPAWYFSGYGGTTTLWMLPCSGLVVLRWGNDPKEWETSTIPNLLLTGMARPLAAGRAEAPSPRRTDASRPWLATCKR